MGAGVLIADATFGGVPGLIAGAILNQVLCTPAVKENADEPKLEVQTPLKTTGIDGAKTVYFDFDKYALNAQGKVDAKATAEALKTMPDVPVRIEGNADSRGSDEYNYALALKRANAVKEALVNAGVTNKLEVVSYGEAKPACTDATEDCFAKNRRVDFKRID
jgi:peptidoglycan-associated lipoprotein